jgi:hypothetical protein
MDPILTMRGKGLVGFRPRVLSLRSRPSVWLRLLACFLGLFTILGTFSHLAGHPDIFLLRAWSRFSRPAVLRPGQYRETAGHHFAVESPGQNAEADEMGMAHDKRSVRSGITSRVYL